MELSCFLKSEMNKLLELFKPSAPLLEPERRQWMFDTTTWALDHLDSGFFLGNSVLVTPDNRHFPGRSESVDEMAQLIFSRVQHYAGMDAWPMQLINQQQCAIQPTEARFERPAPLRSCNAQSWQTGTGEPLPIYFNPEQVNKPEALIASLAYGLSHYLGVMAKEKPPGGEESWTFTCEVIAIFMGFGLMFANTAYTFRGGCGSCFNAGAERSAALSEDESTYLLALFCCLKQIPMKEPLRYLKKSLRPFFKKAYKEINTQGDCLKMLEMS